MSKPKTGSRRFRLEQLESRDVPTGQPFTQGNILVDAGVNGGNGFVQEYTPSGAFIQQINIPASSTVFARGLAVAGNGDLVVFNGTFYPTLSVYDPVADTWTDYTYPGWSTVNVLNNGSVTTRGNYAYVTDDVTYTGGGEPEGIVRFNVVDGSAERFVVGKDYSQLRISPDGLLYALNGHQIDIYDPDSFALIRTMSLANVPNDWLYGMTVNAAGEVYVARGPYIYRVAPDGTVLGMGDMTVIASNLENIWTMDISPDGTRILAVGGSGRTTIMDLDFSNPNVFMTTGGYAFGTFVNIPNPGKIQFSASSYSIAEQGSPTLQVHVMRAGGSEGSLSVNYATSGGSAVAGTDYTAASGTLHWAAGDMSDQTFDVPILDDGLTEGNKTIGLVLGGESPSGTLGDPASATVTILEPSELGLNVSEFAVNESDGALTVTVHRNVNGQGIVSVHYATSNGTARESDYTPTSGTLTWADGNSQDQQFSIPITDDNLNEGNETLTVTLSAPTGYSELGGSSATVTIAKSNGTTIDALAKQPRRTFIDSDGDLATLSLSGKVGTLTYYLTNGVGPLSEIDLNGTTSVKSAVTLAVKKSKSGDGRIGIGMISGSGAKALALAKADLDGAFGTGINLASFLASLTIGSVRNGADINLNGAPPIAGRSTMVTVGVVDDGTNISINDAPLGRLKATRIGRGTISAPSIGSITVTGKAKTKSAMAIPGNLMSNLTIDGTGLSAGAAALKSLTVTGSVSGSTITVGSGLGTVGDVGKVSVGSFVNSRLLAGYTGADDGSGAFNLASTVSSFRVGDKANAFAHSYVIAASFDKVTLMSVDPDNGGTPFGFVYHELLSSLVVKASNFRFDTNGPAIQDMLPGDFEVKRP